MLRYHRFTVGSAWIPEYGSSDKPAAFRWLFAYSPLQNVRKGACYPATLLLAADHDDRVVPSHSYKFTAGRRRRGATGPSSFACRATRATGTRRDGSRSPNDRTCGRSSPRGWGSRRAAAADSSRWSGSAPG
ncbi:MAG TPA: prolyl oligopeptidase family serine peptidase [Thermoanaerobaculia bacterium]|nr:prolyl oligopeptidase family serine peptidase [Thermoanaerobaculia bacterium]